MVIPLGLLKVESTPTPSYVSAVSLPAKVVTKPSGLILRILLLLLSAINRLPKASAVMSEWFVKHGHGELCHPNNPDNRIPDTRVAAPPEVALYRPSDDSVQQRKQFHRYQL